MFKIQGKVYEVCILDEKIISTKVYQDQKDTTESSGKVDNPFGENSETPETMNTCPGPPREPSFVSLFAIFRRLIHI